MSHLDEGTLHALLDGELEVHEVAEIQAHLGSCSSCGLRLREVKEFLAEADRLIASVELDARVEMPAPRREPLVAAASTPAAARPEPTVAPRPAPSRRGRSVLARPKPPPHGSPGTSRSRSSSSPTTSPLPNDGDIWCSASVGRRWC